MKAAHIVTSFDGGAARAAERIGKALYDRGVESELFALSGNNGSGNIIYAQTLVDKIRKKVDMKLNGKVQNNLKGDWYMHLNEIAPVYSGFDRLKEYDLIHLHWINKGIWSKEFIGFLIRLGKPVVWTLHDMWPFTGGCHYPGDCEGYLSGCKECSHVNKRSVTEDLVNYKICSYKSLNIRFVGCSNWITDEFNKSYIARESEKKAIWIANPIPLRYFEIKSREACRSVLGIESKKKMILFGAQSSDKDMRKGYDLLKKALEGLDPDTYCFGIFGNSERTDLDDRFDVYNFGIVNDDLHLSAVYGASDVFVAPSRQENFANTVMEALSCGIPVAAFDIGGMRDMISDGKNGALVTKMDADSLMTGMEKAAGITDRTYIRNSVVSKYSPRTIADNYSSLYGEML